MLPEKSIPVYPGCMFQTINSFNHVCCFIEPTCAYARWVLMHRFAPVRLSLDQNSLDNNSYLDNYRATKITIVQRLAGVYLTNKWRFQTNAGGLTSMSSCFILFVVAKIRCGWAAGVWNRNKSLSMVTRWTEVVRAGSTNLSCQHTWTLGENIRGLTSQEQKRLHEKIQGK